MSWNHGYDLDEYQTRTINGGDHGITWRDIFKCQSFTETLFGVPWSQRFFLIFYRMGELRESREVANTIRGAARDTVRRLTRASLPQKYFHRFPLFTTSNANSVIAAVFILCILFIVPIGFRKISIDSELELENLSSFDANHGARKN